MVRDVWPIMRCQCEFQFALHLLSLLIAHGCRRIMYMYTLATLILCPQHVASRKCFSCRIQLCHLGNIGSIRTGAITGCWLPNAHFSSSFFYFCASPCEVLEISHQPAIMGRLLAACIQILCTVFCTGPGNCSIDFHCKLGGMLSHSFLPFELLWCNVTWSIHWMYLLKWNQFQVQSFTRNFCNLTSFSIQGTR